MGSTVNLVIILTIALTIVLGGVLSLVLILRDSARARRERSQGALRSDLAGGETLGPDSGRR